MLEGWQLMEGMDLSEGIWYLFFSDLLHFVLFVSRAIRISACGTVLSPFFLSNIPLYRCITSSISIPLSVGF